MNDNLRRRLAAKGKSLGRKLLGQLAAIVTPDTILRWHRKGIGAKWTFRPKRSGRPGVMREVVELTIGIAKSNPSWGS